jgi:hypothetical protein
MSLIKANAVQVGQSPTATQNFTLAVPSSPDGTIKLARGNAGVTTQDVLTVDTSGNINGNVLANGTTTARNLATRFADVVNVKDFGAVGNGSDDDTIAFQNFFNAGGGFIPAGTYMINDTTISNVVDVYCDANAIIKKRSGTTANSILVNFQAGSENSKWNGGIIDGNRGVLKPAYNAISPVPAYFFGWFGMKTGASHITVSNVTFQNFVTKPVWFSGDYNIINDILFKDCGAAAVFGWHWFGNGSYPTRPSGDGAYGQSVKNITSLRHDNDGVANSQHAIDLQSPSFGNYSDFSVTKQNGDTFGTSQWISGITIEKADNCNFNNWRYESPLADNLRHLATSFLGCVDCTLSNLVVYNIAGLALELNGCRNLAISNPILDGNYATTTTVPSGDVSSLGVSYYNGVWNKQRTSKSLIQSANCTITGGIIKRFSRGAILRATDLAITGVNIYGNLFDGVYAAEEILDDYFAGANTNYTNSLRISNCNITSNGSCGLEIEDIESLEISGGKFTNNGQNAASSHRDGLRIQKCSKAKVIGADLCDTQNWTDIDICSYEPQSPINGRVVVYVSVSGRLQDGQFINLVNAGGGSDVIGKIVNIGTNDDITIETSASLSSTGNTTALTGTWAGSGTTLTGAGTLATTEITGQTYVTNGSEWRRITKATVDNSIIINEPFSTPLSGATLTKITVDVSGIQSQENGIRAFGNALKLLIAKNNYDGNLVEKTFLSTPANCIYGSEYIRYSSTNPTLVNTNIQSNIPQGHRLTGIATNNTVAISGGGVTDYSLIVIDSLAATLETITTNVGLSQNTKITGVVGGVTMLENNNAIRAVFSGGGAPTAGTIACEAMYKVDSVPSLPSV